MSVIYRTFFQNRNTRRQGEYYIEILFYSTRGLLRKNQILEKYLLLVRSVAAAFRRLGPQLKERPASKLAFVRRAIASISGRPDRCALAWHVAEYPDHIQFIARNVRPAKRDGTHIAENRKEALGTGDRSALVDATNRDTGGDNIVVNRDEG
jgi:hypothetical protein